MSTSQHSLNFAFNVSLDDQLDSLDMPSEDASRQRPNLLDSYLGLALYVHIIHGLPILVTIFGILTNIANVVTFISSGLKDSVSISFAALSFSDLGYCTMFFFNKTIALLLTLYPSIGYYTVWVVKVLPFGGYLFQDISTLITVFVVVQKCCCVGIPHLFKNVFSAKRTMAILVCFSLSLLAVYIPIYSGLKLTTMPVSSSSNNTIILPAQSSLYRRAFSFWLIFNKVIFPVSCQGIIVVSLLLMAKFLVKSAKFRSSSDKDPEGNKFIWKLGNKERRALQAVAVVALIYLISNLMSTVYALAYQFAPEMLIVHFDLSSFFQKFIEIPIQISASINIFCYLKFNTKFKITAVSFYNRFLCGTNGEEAKTRNA